MKQPRAKVRVQVRGQHTFSGKEHILNSLCLVGQLFNSASIVQKQPQKKYKLMNMTVSSKALQNRQQSGFCPWAIICQPLVHPSTCLYARMRKLFNRNIFPMFRVTHIVDGSGGTRIMKVSVRKDLDLYVVQGYQPLNRRPDSWCVWGGNLLWGCCKFICTPTVLCRLNK